MRNIWGILSLVFVLCSAELALATDIDWSAHGYFRSRSAWLHQLDLQSPSTANNDRLGLIQYHQMRFRVNPTLKLNDWLSIHGQIDALDNLTFGSEDTDQLKLTDPIIGTITLPAGAGSLGAVPGASGLNGNLNVKRAWMDIQTAVGKLRIGRQPSHWGLGIFQNSGDDINDDFGDSADRILFVTQKGMGRGALTMGALWDVSYESQRDPRIGGLADAIRENGQDTNQWAGILLYEQPEFDVGVFGGVRRRNGSNGSTTTACGNDAPVFANGDATCTLIDGSIGRQQSAGIDGNSLVYFADAYAKARFDSERYGEHTIGAEYVYIGGKISTGVALDAIPFQGLPTPGIIQLPANQDLSVHMAALEAEGKYDWGGEWKLQGGFAQGDGSPLSQRITQYGFRPDYDLGMLMFHMPLGTSPILRDGTSGTALAGGVPITGNYINNAYYAGLTYKHRFNVQRAIPQANEFKVGARVITAMAHKDPVSLDFDALLGGTDQFPSIQSRGKWYGVEANLLLEATFFDRLHTNLETGVLFPGSAFDINTNLIDPGSIVATISADPAEIAYGGRLNLTMEF